MAQLLSRNTRLTNALTQLNLQTMTPLRLLLSPKIRKDFQLAQARQKELIAKQDHDWSAWQLEMVRKNWADAIVDVPYYSNLVANREAPRVISSWDDFQAIPVLTRQIVQDRSAEFVRRSGPPNGYTSTAGSTGTPLKIGMNQSCRDLMRIVKLAAWLDFGYSLDSHVFLIWGHSHLLGTGWRGKLNHLKRKLADSVLGYSRVDAYNLSAASCEKYATELIRHRPLGIIGYASALDLFTRHTAEFREQFRKLSIRFVLATAEPMPKPDTHSLIEDHFGCPVVQEYGGADFGQVAFKKGLEPFGVYSDIVYLECLDENSVSSQSGSAVLTTLYPRYTPWFRYETGDAILGVTRLSHRHVTQFATLGGRQNDMIHFADGTSIHSVAIFHCIHQEKTVHSIQMLLTNDGIEILLAGPPAVDAAVERRIRTRLAQVYAPLGTARIRFVDDLLTNRAGKRRWFVDQRSSNGIVHGH